MKTIRYNLNLQRGVASLFTAVVLLTCITLVALFTSKTVLMETKITADDYRTNQATAAATAAMENAVVYFVAGGIDQINNTTGAAGADDVVDYTEPEASRMKITLNSGSQQQTTAYFYFENRPCIDAAPGDPRIGTNPTHCLAPNNTAHYINVCDKATNNGLKATDMTRTLVVAEGWSDDYDPTNATTRAATRPIAAHRTITQCLGTYKIFDNGTGPEQPFVSKASVGLTGSATIINRYSNTSIWTGNAFSISGSAMRTYLRPSNMKLTDYSKLQLDSACEATPCNDANNPGPNAQKVSDNSAGAGIDVITDDPNLKDANVFDLFFSQTKTQVADLADSAGQKYPAGSTIPSDVSGVVWIGGDGAASGSTTINGGTVGAPGKPVILIVNGDLSLAGNTTIHGLVYVMGELNVGGTAVVKGSIVSESGVNGGSGNLTLVYVPFGSGSEDKPTPIVGTMAIIAGSWKDW